MVTTGKSFLQLPLHQIGFFILFKFNDVTEPVYFVLHANLFTDLDKTAATIHVLVYT